MSRTTIRLLVKLWERYGSCLKLSKDLLQPIKPPENRFLYLFKSALLIVIVTRTLLNLCLHTGRMKAATHLLIQPQPARLGTMLITQST